MAPAPPTLAPSAEGLESSEVPADRSRIAELEEALAARDDLIRLIGHELRNPLSPVYLQACHLIAEVQRRGDDGTFEGRWLSPRLERIQRGLERLVERLNGVMDLAALQSPDGIALTEDTLDLGSVAADVADSARAEAAAAGVPIRVHAPAPVVGRWDRARLAQMIGGLVSNAIRHGGGTPVDVTVEERGADAVVVVRDHGPGIDPAKAERLFDRLERLSPRPQKGGLGIGLWIVGRLCKAMGGTISLADAGPGASLEVSLPRGTTAANDANGE